MRIKLRFLFILVCILIQLPAQASLTATLDKQQTSLNQPVQLNIVSDRKQDAQELDISALEQDFDIIGRSNSSEISTLNGVASIKSIFLLILMPKREGILNIPILELGNEQTEPLSLTVSAASITAPASQADKDTPGVLIETMWEHPGKAYVQSQLNLVVRIYHQGNLLEAALDEPHAQNTLIKRIGDDVPGVHSKQGVQYQTIERRYALFPQKSGTLTIPPVALQVRLSDPQRQTSRRFGFDPFIRGQRLTLRSEPLSIDINPPVKEFTGSTWLPSVQVTLKRRGLPEKAIIPGDAINMQIDLSALGLTGTQLPEITIPNLNGQFKLYPDEPAFADTSADGKIIKGNRTQTFVLIASEAGALEIPEISVAWWDVKNDRQQYARLAAVSVEVLAVKSNTDNTAEDATENPGRKPQFNASISEQTHQISQADGSDSFWMWLSVFSVAGWLLSIAWFVTYYAQNRRPHKNPAPTGTTRDLRSLITKIRNAASDNDAQGTWQALQEYARARWPKHPPGPPEEWARLLELSQGGQIIAELDKHLFRGSENHNWNGEAIRKILLPTLDASSFEPEQAAAPGVPKLYPSA